MQDPGQPERSPATPTTIIQKAEIRTVLITVPLFAFFLLDNLGPKSQQRVP